MDRLHQLSDNIKTIILETINENLVRPKKETHSRLSVCGKGGICGYKLHRHPLRQVAPYIV